VATDATGTPTSLGIPTYNTSVDAPSGNGFNAAMLEIDTLIKARMLGPTSPADGDVPVWDSATSTWKGSGSGSKKIPAASLDTPPALIKLWDSVEAGVTFPAASITTPALSAAYKHLRIEYNVAASTAAFLTFRVNGDSGANYYAIQDINAVSTTVNPGTQLSLVHISSLESSSGTLVIPNYSTAMFSQRQILGHAFSQNDGSGNMHLFILGGAWNASAAISTLTFGTTAGNITGGRITVYGEA